MQNQEEKKKEKKKEKISLFHNVTSHWVSTLLSFTQVFESSGNSGQEN